MLTAAAISDRLEHAQHLLRDMDSRDVRRDPLGSFPRLFSSAVLSALFLGYAFVIVLSYIRVFGNAHDRDTCSAHSRRIYAIIYTQSYAPGRAHDRYAQRVFVGRRQPLRLPRRAECAKARVAAQATGKSS